MNQEKNYKLGKYLLDKQQSKIVYDKSKELLVIAGAGSGKTLTIVAKIDYLIKKCSINPKDIIGISFTNAATKSLKNKIKDETGYDVPIYTFHSLGMSIIKKYDDYDICDEYLLENITTEFFRSTIFSNKKLTKLLYNYFNLRNKKSYLKFYDKHYDKILKLEKTIVTFIKLFKANNYSLKDFSKFSKKSKSIFNFKNWDYEYMILPLILNVYLIYHGYLKENNEIDFDDILTKAKFYVDKYGFNKRIKYIIIDEYQDTSLVRLNLIRSILNKTNASLIAVGDDFQSIYHFSGCDLNLFLNFKKIFPNSKILKIEKTYRNSQELVDIAGKFILRNKDQLYKKLVSDKSLVKPIKIVLTNNFKQALTNTINFIYENYSNEILILGRNNNDINYFLDINSFKISNDKILSLKNPNVNIKYMTIHKSKGLESENVIIVNLEDTLNGLPNKFVNDDLLKYVSKKFKFPYSEERRLFYVALTRTKNNVFLISSYKNKSIFVQELLKYDKQNVDTILY